MRLTRTPARCSARPSRREGFGGCLQRSGGARQFRVLGAVPKGGGMAGPRSDSWVFSASRPKVGTQSPHRCNTWSPQAELDEQRSGWHGGPRLISLWQPQATLGYPVPAYPKFTDSGELSKFWTMRRHAGVLKKWEIDRARDDMSSFWGAFGLSQCWYPSCASLWALRRKLARAATRAMRKC